MNLSKGWIECKSHNGKKYYFNKRTKEKSWTRPTNDTNFESKSPFSSKPNTSCRTPAQDRLNRLQNRLQKDVAKKKTSSTKRLLPSVKPNQNTKDTKKDCLKTKLLKPSKSVLHKSISPENNVKSTKRKLETDDLVDVKRSNILLVSNDFSDNVPTININKEKSLENNITCSDLNVNLTSTAITNRSNSKFNSRTEHSTLPFSNKSKKVSANTRLELLRKSLQKATKKCISSVESMKNALPFNFNNCHSNPVEPSASSPCNNTSDISNFSDYEEKMDWEETENNNEKQNEEFKSYTDIVKQNLEKLIEVSANDSSNLNINAFYIVIDTNIFLKNLSFLDSLVNLQFCDHSTVLYVPYCVLQELDKIKSNKAIPISTNAQRAVRYINEKLQENSSSVKGQSAIEDRTKLIEINCADDNILNCCLLLKRRVKNVLLLSNDVNLRNKAICNKINVSTKSELESLNT